jgi:hypothetical protein
MVIRQFRIGDAVVGVGRAWGNKMNYVQSEFRLDQ